MTTSTAEAGLKLAAWLSPAFPVGGFSYSHGLEWAIEDGTVTTAAALGRWLHDILDHGAGRSDAILLARAHALTAAEDWSGLADLLDLAAALQPARERHLEATAQGAAFVRAVSDSYPSAALAAMQAGLSARAPTWTYPTAVGAAAACHGIARAQVLPLYLQAFAANVVSAGVRAVPLGQTDGLKLVAALGPRIARLCTLAETATLDDLGGAVFRADIAAMRHETQYTRLFRS